MNNSSIAFLFPGQGSQSVGMGKDLYDRYPSARGTFEEADEAVGTKLSQLCFEGPEEQLKRTENTQPAILTVSVAAWRVLDEKGIKPAFAAGHSLGEYSAHVASGTISFDGQDITRLATHERVRRGMARTFQITEIFPELNVFENVRIAAEVAGGYRLRPWINRAEAAKIHQHVEDTLKLVGLETKTNRLVGELSHGDQRAAEIAMALSLKPHLLLLDEPTAGMGDQETYQITQLVRRLHRDSNYTIVLIEHDMRVVFHLADRICVLDQGKMLAQGTPKEIAANEAVQAAYLGTAA